eukprot:scaffold173856_cov30-Prasinocladus_malaysianus.AAC.1
MLHLLCSGDLRRKATAFFPFVCRNVLPRRCWLAMLLPVQASHRQLALSSSSSSTSSAYDEVPAITMMMMDDLKWEDEYCAKADSYYHLLTEAERDAKAAAKKKASRGQAASLPVRPIRHENYKNLTAPEAGQALEGAEVRWLTWPFRGHDTVAAYYFYILFHKSFDCACMAWVNVKARDDSGKRGRETKSKNRKVTKEKNRKEWKQ